MSFFLLFVVGICTGIKEKGLPYLKSTASPVWFIPAVGFVVSAVVSSDLNNKAVTQVVAPALVWLGFAHLILVLPLAICWFFTNGARDNATVSAVLVAGICLQFTGFRTAIIATSSTGAMVAHQIVYGFYVAVPVAVFVVVAFLWRWRQKLRCCDIRNCTFTFPTSILATAVLLQTSTIHPKNTAMIAISWLCIALATLINGWVFCSCVWHTICEYTSKEETQPVVNVGEGQGAEGISIN